MKMIIGVFVALFIFVSSISIEPCPAHAEEAYSLAPFFHEVELSSEKAAPIIPVTLTNRTRVDATFGVTVRDFGALDDSGGVAFLGRENDFRERYGLASWMRLGTRQVTVPAGGEETVIATIEDRTSLSPGGHYGAIVFELLTEDDMSGDSASVSVRTSFATLVFVNKQGGEIREMEYADLSIRNRDILGIPEKVTLRLHNTGNTHLTPRGRIEVRDIFGHSVREGTVNEASGRMLPESFRGFPVQLRYTGQAFLPAPYRVVVSYRYDGHDAFETREAMVWPVGNLVFSMAGLVLIAVFVVCLRRYRIKRNAE